MQLNITLQTINEDIIVMSVIIGKIMHDLFL